MAKDVVISTSRLNSYGTRILTSGINIEQYKRNPILLYMHERGRVIGKIENLRFEGDRLIGTPIFDMEDDEAAKIGRKWDNDFLNMCSGGFEPVELSNDPQYLVPGQSRSTVVRSVLVEVSIADLGSNDDSLKLYEPDGKLLKLAAGVESEIVPLLKLEKQPEAETPAEAVETKDNNNQTNFTMNKILLTLGLAATANEEDAVNAITKLQESAKKADTIELARIETAVDAAIKAHKTTADKRDHLITLGKNSGFDSLQVTLDMLTPVQKPNQLINPSGSAASGAAIELSYSKMSEEGLKELRENNRPEYIRLFKAEFGFVPEIEK